jgi:hypothetical protein
MTSQFTTNAKNFLQVNSQMHTSDRGLSHTFKGHWAVANGLRCIKKCVGEMSVHFLLELNRLGCLSVPTDKVV